MCRLLVTASVVPSSPILVTLMKEALGSPETSVLTRGTLRNIPEDTILQFCFLRQHNAGSTWQETRLCLCQETISISWPIGQHKVTIRTFAPKCQRVKASFTHTGGGNTRCAYMTHIVSCFACKWYIIYKHRCFSIKVCCRLQLTTRCGDSWLTNATVR
jgi:hypothetical protein